MFFFAWSHICHLLICAAPEVPEIFLEGKNLKVPASMCNSDSEFRDYIEKVKSHTKGENSCAVYTA